MSKRIQAYFRTENEAEGAKTSLISYKVEGLEVSALEDPLDHGNRSNRNFLLPLVPYNSAAVTGAGVGGVTGTTGGGFPGSAVIPAVVASDDLVESENRDDDGDVQKSEDFENGDLDNLHYVMDLKVPAENYLEVIETLRSKHAFVEVFE